MVHKLSVLMAIIWFAGSLICESAQMRKKNISVGEARREVGIVAAYQFYPKDYRIDRFGSLEVGGEYFHIFYCELEDIGRWRTLVFDNQGSYLGFYQTVDPPVELEKDALVFPGDSFSSETGDEVEGEFDSGDAHIIRFAPTGPPDEVKFENRTYVFASSPRRIRPEEPAYRYIKVANRVADCINQGRYKRVRDDFSPEALKRISEQKVEAILSGIREKVGRVEKLGVPWVKAADTAVLPIFFEEEVAGLKLVLSGEDQIIGLWVLPFQEAFPDLGTNQTEMKLPVRGRWRLVWGGSKRKQSKYFGSRVGHNALELVVSNRFGKTHKGDGKKNKEYFAFEQPVLAPAAGRVVMVINSVEDNHPRSPNPFDRLGNAVMIEHAPNEFSVIGHLLEKSIRVNVGDTVVALQPIGQCGNSGDSAQPSVHFHIQDTPELLGGASYRVEFSNLYVWQKKNIDIAEKYSPVRGEFVQQRSKPIEGAPTGQGGKPKAVGQ